MVKQALRDGNLPSSRKLPLSGFFKQLSPSPQRNLSSLSCRFLFFFSPLTSSGYPLLASTGHYLPSCAPHQQVWALQPPSWPTITPLAMCMQLGSMHREGSPHTSKKCNENEKEISTLPGPSPQYGLKFDFRLLWK